MVDKIVSEIEALEADLAESKAALAALNARPSPPDFYAAALQLAQWVAARLPVRQQDVLPEHAGVWQVAQRVLKGGV